MAKKRKPPRGPRVIRVLQKAKQHPSRGGNAYSIDFRSVCVREYRAGTYRIGAGKPSMQTVARWDANDATRNSLRPYEKKGNNAASVLHGEDRVWLALYRKVYPKASAAEVMAFIFNHSSNPRMYTSGQISQCEIDLGLTRKVASTTANQAMLQANLDRCHRFWNMPYPMGITDTVLEECIDIDECAITLNDCVRHVGKACLGIRVNEAGNYSRGQKFTLILGVRPNGPPVWQFSEARGTSGEAFSAFLENKVFSQLQGPTTLLWDNLRSHHTAQVVNLVHNSPHRILARPNYRPQDGPVEYANNQLLTMMRMECYTITSVQQLIDAMPRLIGQISNMGETFKMCGY